MATILTKAIIQNATSAVDTYISTVTGLYNELQTLVNTLTTVNFQGDASAGFKQFFTEKATPVLTDSLTAQGTSLTAGIKNMLGNISTSLLDQVDVQLGESNRNAGNANTDAKA